MTHIKKRPTVIEIVIAFVLIAFSLCVALYNLLPVIVGLLWHISVGWVFYMSRTLPRLQIPPESALFCVAGLLYLLLISHCFLKWLRSNTAIELRKPRWRIENTTKLLGITLLAFAAGICGTCIVHQLTWIPRSTMFKSGSFIGPANHTVSDKHLQP